MIITRVPVRFLTLCAIVLQVFYCGLNEGFGQAPAAGGAQATAQPAPPAASQTAAAPVVQDAYHLGFADPSIKDRSLADIDDIIVVTVQGLQGLLNQSQCVDGAGAKVTNCVALPLALFFDGREMKGIALEAADTIAQTLQFHLYRTDQNTEAWADLLGAPPLGQYFFVRPTKVSVGLSGGSAVATTVNGFLLQRMAKGWFVAAVVGIGLMILAIFVLAPRTDLLRAAGSPPVDANNKPLPKAYSLARFQMAFWFVLVIASFSFLWVVTGASNTITTSILTLIGIGSGTALGAAVVDANKGQPAPPSERFLKDILSDEHGVCFHRFQMFVWTLVLGVIFVSSVYYSLSMPEFNATLLALQGISAGTYLGFKIPEKS